MHRLSTLIAAALLTASLIVAPVVAAQETTADQAAERAAAEAAAASAPRFQPSANGYAGCANEPTAEQRIAPTVPPGFVAVAGMNGGPGWQVSAPRAPIKPGEVAKLTLRDKFGTADRRVYTEVSRPDTAMDRSPTWLWGDRAATASYPSSFIGAPPLVPGTYTVVWRDTLTDGFLACDGFVVAP